MAMSRNRPCPLPMASGGMPTASATSQPHDAVAEPSCRTGSMGRASGPWKRRTPFGAGLSPATNPRMQVRTFASNIDSSAHQQRSIRASRSTASRIGATSRVASTDIGSTRPIRPPGLRTSRGASARNSAATSAYGPPPRRELPPRAVPVESCERYGGLPITTSKACEYSGAPSTSRASPRSTRHPSRRSVSAAVVSSSSTPTRNGAGSIPYRSVIAQPAASSNRPSPHAGSMTNGGVAEVSHHGRSTSRTSRSTSAGGV